MDHDKIKAEFELDDAARKRGIAAAEYIMECERMYGKLTAAQIAKEKRARFAEFLQFCTGHIDQVQRNGLRFCFEQGYKKIR